jgi:hypothetical protein
MGSRSIKAAKVRVGELLLVICSLVNNDLAGAFAAPTGGAPRQVCPGSEFRTLWARRTTDGRPCRRDHSRMASGFVHRCVPSTKHAVHEPKSRPYEIVGDVVRSHGCRKGDPIRRVARAMRPLMPTSRREQVVDYGGQPWATPSRGRIASAMRAWRAASSRWDVRSATSRPQLGSRGRSGAPFRDRQAAIIVSDAK